MVGVLQFGAIGIGLAVLAYTASLLRLELAKPVPRTEARNLILMYMAFSLVAFGLAAYIEIEKRRGDIAEIASGIDARLDDKHKAAVESAPAQIKETLIFFDNALCRDLKTLKKMLSGSEDSHCKISQ